MKSIITKTITALLLLNTTSMFSQENKKNQGLFFQENKGQICDQNYKPRPDVLFSGFANGLNYHLTKTGISYQLSKVESWREVTEQKSKTKLKTPDKTSIYRVDVQWLGINENVQIEKGDKLEGISNYYLPQCPDGVLNVNSYSSLTYKNIYYGIDLKWYDKNGSLEYDFIVSSKADASQIKLQFKGAEKLTINKKGELEITTPLGMITEKAPIAYQEGKEIRVKWVLNNENLSFEIENYNKNLPLIIDPIVRLWGTYYGGNFDEHIRDITTDAANNSYAVGYSSSSSGTTIATVGSHQRTHAGGTFDAFMVKFNSAGVRQWATYNGGTGLDFALSTAIDNVATPGVYLAGYTASGNGISTVGSHQTAFSGANDAFLSKFNSATGARMWATYYGDTGNDYGYSCETDGLNNIILVGETALGSSTLFATPGAHQTTYGGGSSDGFIVKFNALGVRQWGTYYGGNGGDNIKGCDVNKTTNNIAIDGNTTSLVGISTVGSFQTTFSGASDGFAARFNSSGVRQWGTYFGGIANDFFESCSINAADEVYATGNTNSTGLGSPGAHQINIGGGTDAFLVKFSSNGATKLWCTYYGGFSTDKGLACSLDNSGNIYISGNTLSSSNISTFGAHQTTFGGGVIDDAFISAFDPSGVHLFGSYYGGNVEDLGWSCKPDNAGNVYLVGSTKTTTANIIATSGGHQNVYGGGTYDAFITKFFVCQNLNLTVTGTSTLCSGSNATLTASGTGFTTYTWSTGPITSSIAVSPTTTTTYTLIAGTPTAGCIYSDVKTITVTSSPTINIASSSSSICSGSSATLTASGASTYTWNTGATSSVIIVSPSLTTLYTATGTAASACKNTQTLSLAVGLTPTVTIVATPINICSGFNTTLVANGASTYTWSTGAISQSIVISPTITSAFSATGTAVSSCKNSATVTIFVTTTPILTTSNYTICPGGTATLTASGATTYSWNTGATTSSITVSPIVNTIYTITGTNGTCTDVNTVSVTIGSALSIPIIPSASSVCIGNSATLTASGATTYTWNTSSNSSSIVVSPTTTTTYTVSGNSGACAGTNTISLIVNPNPTVTASSSSTLLCVGNNVSLNATGATSYTWNPGNLSGSSVTVSPISNITYTVTGFNANGCMNNNTLFLTVSPCTGVNDSPLNASVKVYPNPTNGDAVIIDVEKDVELNLINTLGQVLFETKLISGINTIRITDLPNGIYYIKITQQFQSSTVKLIKQ